MIINKRNNGITLISLVVTIIILLILATITINLLIGDNGIIKKAKEAAEISKNAGIEEQIGFNELYNQMDDLVDSNIIQNLGVGWTLGNSLDCYTDGTSLTVEQYETLWNNPVTTKNMITKVKEFGFKTILIPVTWFNHLDEENNIKQEWMDRVKEVVDYAIDNNMYVILNTHHDDKKFTFDSSPEDFNLQIIKYKKIWKQISDTFNNYNEKLIFEILNEPRLITDGEDVWHVTDQKVYDNLNKLSEELVKSIRESDNYNKSRYILIPTYGTLITNAVLENMKLPQDNRIAISVHGYLPSGFCSNTETRYTEDMRNTIQYQIDLISRFSKNNNIPIIVTEMGCYEKTDRNIWLRDIFLYLGSKNIPAIWWDNGEKYSVFDRNTLTIRNQDAVDIMQSYYNQGKNFSLRDNKINGINTTQNVDYDSENMGVKIVNGKNRYYVDMDLNKDIRFKFSDTFELNDTGIYNFSCKIKTNMDSLKVRLLLNFYDENGQLLYTTNFSNIGTNLVDGTKEIYEFNRLYWVEGAKKVQLEKLSIGTVTGMESQYVNFEIYDFALNE